MYVVWGERAIFVILFNPPYIHITTESISPQSILLLLPLLTSLQLITTSVAAARQRDCHCEFAACVLSSFAQLASLPPPTRHSH